MCSELFRIPLDWLKAPVMSGVSVSMLLALAIGVGIVKLLLWGKKTKRSAEAWGYVPGLVIFAAVLLLVPRFVEAIPIRGYGVFVLIGSISGLLMAAHRARQKNLPTEVIFSLAFGMFICGIIGARLFFVIEYWESRFQKGDLWQTLLEIVKFTEGGLVVYGSLIGATLAFLVFTVRHRLPPLAIADMIAPSLLIGLAFGRIGCLLNGCCYGGESSQPWAVTFPRDSMPYMEQVASGRMYGFKLIDSDADDRLPIVATVEAGSAAEQLGMQAGMKIKRIDGQSLTSSAVDKQSSLEQANLILFGVFSEQNKLRIENQAGDAFTLPAPVVPPRSFPVHPTQIYSAIHAALLSWVLWSFYPLCRRDGEVTALMLTVYPISRFLLEIIRIDESAVFGTGLSISQNISIVILIGAIGLWVYLRRQEPSRAVFGAVT